MPVNEPSYDVAVETSWDGVDQSEFEDFQEFASVHVWWNTDNPETGEDVELPVAHKEDGELKLVYEALNSAHDLAKQAVGEDNAEQVRELLENLREKEFPDREPLNEKTESRSEAIERIAGYLGKDISEDEVGDCISEKVDEGWDRDRAIAACLSMAESGSVDDEINAMNPETFEEHRQIMEENKDAIERKNFMVKGSDVEVIKDHEDGTVVNVPIQALEEDRDGDFINEKGQESIVSQLKTGRVPLVPNHGVGDSEAHYGFEDIFGQFVDGQNRNGTTIGTARLREDHEKSKELVDLLEQDMPVGFSVGFRVLEADPREKDEGDGEGMEISDVDLMEVSAVGIPSNPEAVPQAMGNAVAMAKNAGMAEPEIKRRFEEAFKQDTMSDEQDNTETQNEKQGDTPERVLTDQDVLKIKEVFKSTVLKHKAEQVKAEGDVTDQSLLEFTASHFEGVDVADLLDAVDSEGGEYIGSLNLPEAASLLADRMDIDQGSVLDTLEELDSADEENEPQDEEETNESDDEDNEEDEEMDSETDEQDSEKESTAQKNKPESQEIKEVDSGTEKGIEDEKKKSDETGFGQFADRGEFW